MMTTPIDPDPSITYTLAAEKSTGPEMYTIFASKDLPRILVCEDVQNGMSLELTKIGDNDD